ncbi:hypothetical protein IIA15_01010 [candidate division TA06 bacterium]|nr:hypothetical protein [candidate division TA06 bacterium]
MTAQKEVTEKATCNVCFGQNVHYKDGCQDCGHIQLMAKAHTNIGDTIVFIEKKFGGVDFASPVDGGGFKTSLFYNKAGAIALRDFLNEQFPEGEEMKPEGNIKEWTGGQLAEWLHNSYEDIAKEVGWSTQEKCRVPFSELPAENRRVMLYLAQKIQLELMEDPK